MSERALASGRLAGKDGRREESWSAESGCGVMNEAEGTRDEGERQKALLELS